MTAVVKRALIDRAGTLRCCTSALPADFDGWIIAGEDGQHAPCIYCKGSDKMRSGFVYVESTNKWIPAWVYDCDNSPPEAA